MSSERRDPPIDAFRAGLLAFHEGLLTESEETAFREHLKGCEECRRLLETMDGDPESRPTAPDGHIPSSLLARWDRNQKTLSGLERSLVRSHLESCAECRQDLVVLGFEPRLEWVPELETRPVNKIHRMAPAPLASGQAGRATGKPRLLNMPHRINWSSWIMPTWATGATAAALLLVLRQAPNGPSVAQVSEPGGIGVGHQVGGPSNPGTGSSVNAGQTSQTEEPSMSLIALGEVPRPSSMMGVTRGGDDSPTTINEVKVRDSANVVGLSFIPPEFRRNTRVRIRLKAPSGRLVTQMIFASSELEAIAEGSTVLEVRAPGIGREPGIYKLLFTGRLDGGTRDSTIEYTFKLRPAR